MDFSELAKKGLSHARDEFKKFTDSMASDRLHPETTYTLSSYRGVQTIRYTGTRPIHFVGLRSSHHPMSLQPGYGGSYSERTRRGHVGEHGEPSYTSMEGIEPTNGGEWHSVHHPDEYRAFESVDSGRPGKWVFFPNEPLEGQEERPRDTQGEETKEGLREGESREPGSSGLPKNPERFQTHHNATVENSSDLEKIDPQYLNLNDNKEPQQDKVERGPPVPPRPSQPDLEIENAALHESLKVLQNTLDKLDVQMRNSEREKNELKGKLGQYIRKTQQLNQIIIKNANQTNEPSDSEIERATTEISSDITRIIRTHYAGSKIVVNMSAARQYKDEEFYRSIKKLGPETIRRLLCQRLFRLLNSEIFSARIYGLEDEAEKYLEKFERAILSSPKVTRQDADEWRVRTIACATQLDLPLQDKAGLISGYIWQHFYPMELSGPKKNTPAGITDIREALTDLCEKSLKLALKFRSTETRYYFQIPSDCAYLGQYPSEHYQIMGSEGEMSKEAEADVKRQRIYCTLFGALMKTRNATATELQGGKDSGPFSSPGNNLRGFSQIRR